MAGGEEPFHHDDLTVTFHNWDPAEDPPPVIARTLAYVSWAVGEVPGAEACRRLRCNPDTASALIVAVLAEDHPDDRRRALRAGADDCELGPLTRTGVLDRVLALPVEETEVRRAPVARLGDLAVDIAGFRASWRGRTLPLMPNELRLLRFLVEHPGRVFTRAQLIAALGKQNPPIDERTVDVWIGRLRRALRAEGAGLLRTVRGIGYVLDLPGLG